MLTPEQIDALTPKWRTVEIVGLGAVQVKAPTERDICMAANTERAEWWLRSCVRQVDGGPVFPPDIDANALHGVMVSALKCEVFAPLPTVPVPCTG